jgi:hypothetical protein
MSTPLRDLIHSLEVDAASQAAFADDPVAFLADHGWGGLDGLDVGTALSALADEVPIERAIRLGEIVDGGPQFDHSLSSAIQGLSAATEAATATLGDTPVLPSDPDPLADDPVDPETALDREAPTPGGHDGYDGDPTLGIDHRDPSDESTEPTDTGDDPAAAIDSIGEPGRFRDDADHDGLEHIDDLDHLDAGPGHDDAVPADEPGSAQVQPVVEELPGADVGGEVVAGGEPSALDADPVEGLDPVAEHEPLAQEPDVGPDLADAEAAPEADDL